MDLKCISLQKVGRKESYLQVEVTDKHIRTCIPIVFFYYYYFVGIIMLDNLTEKKLVIMLFK